MSKETGFQFEGEYYTVPQEIITTYSQYESRNGPWCIFFELDEVDFNLAEAPSLGGHDKHDFIHQGNCVSLDGIAVFKDQFDNSVKVATLYDKYERLQIELMEIIDPSGSKFQSIEFVAAQ
ncbi:hypothetical protein LPJ68_001971 [Coemansia sp. RSA 1086]|nr:hypothetical protein LPJ68_001971 [Coemansia sp. RSA 1086]